MAITPTYDSQQTNAREAQERFSEGKIRTSPVEQGALQSWLHDIRNATDQVNAMAGNVRAYRIALAGPDDRLEKNPSAAGVDTAPPPSPMNQMSESLKMLFGAINSLQMEYHELEGTGLVNPHADQMF